MHACLSIGKYLRSIGQLAVTVSLWERKERDFSKATSLDSSSEMERGKISAKLRLSRLSSGTNLQGPVLRKHTEVFINIYTYTTNPTTQTSMAPTQSSPRRKQSLPTHSLEDQPQKLCFCHVRAREGNENRARRVRPTNQEFLHEFEPKIEYLFCWLRGHRPVVAFLLETCLKQKSKYKIGEIIFLRTLFALFHIELILRCFVVVYIGRLVQYVSFAEQQCPSLAGSASANY